MQLLAMWKNLNGVQGVAGSNPAVPINEVETPLSLRTVAFFLLRGRRREISDGSECDAWC